MNSRVPISLRQASSPLHRHSCERTETLQRPKYRQAHTSILPDFSDYGEVQPDHCGLTT